MIVIEARGLTKRYGHSKVVDNLNLQVNEGTCFGLLGPNGAGKTTIFRMMYGISPPTSGELYILGLNVKNNIRKIKSQIGIVSQDDGLDTDFTVLDNLLVFSKYFNMTIEHARTRARELLRFLHLEDFEDRTVETLSGGMRRRLAFARALLADPKIVILDEPTTGLDPQARLWVWECINELKKQGKTILLTTHYLEEAEQLCDSVMVIDKGMSVCEGAPKKLILEHIGKEVVEFQIAQDDLDYHINRVQSHYNFQVLNNRVRLFIPPSKDGKEALPLVVSDAVTIRRATLEDVFLKLAGYELRGKELL